MSSADDLYGDFAMDEVTPHPTVDISDSQDKHNTDNTMVSIPFIISIFISLTYY